MNKDRQQIPDDRSVFQFDWEFQGAQIEKKAVVLYRFNE
jgi:hypothetical protein